MKGLGLILQHNSQIYGYPSFDISEFPEILFQISLIHGYRSLDSSRLRLHEQKLIEFKGDPEVDCTEGRSDPVLDSWVSFFQIFQDSLVSLQILIGLLHVRFPDFLNYF